MLDMDYEEMDILDNTTDVESFNASVRETDMFISKESLKTFLFVVSICLIPLCCLFGTVGNLFSIGVLWNRRMRSQSNYILGALCVSDTFFLLHSLCFTFINIYRKLRPIEGEAFRSYVYPIVGAYGSVVTARITSCLTTLLCAERFIAVYFPMQARTICTIKNTCIAIALSYIVTLILFVPFTLKYKSVTFQFNENTTRTVMNKTSLYANNMTFYSAYGTTLNIIFRFAPLLIIVILNILMIRAVHKTWRSRRTMSSLKDTPSSLRLSSRSNRHMKYSDQNHITIMLIIVSFVFVTCILPGALHSIATHIWPRVYTPYGGMKNLYICISTATFLLETINSSMNFLIYIVCYRKFRQCYKEKFCCGHGQYYSKISTSMKEKFRWSSSRKNSKIQESDSYGRRTVSDIGPLIMDGQSLSRRDKCYSDETHSEGCELHLSQLQNQSEGIAITRKKHRGHYLKHLHTRSLCNLLLFRAKKSQSTLDNENINGNSNGHTPETFQHQNGYITASGTDV